MAYPFRLCHRSRTRTTVFDLYIYIYIHITVHSCLVPVILMPSCIGAHGSSYNSVKVMLLAVLILILKAQNTKS